MPLANALRCELPQERQDRRLIDVGCGPGNLARALHDVGVDVVGLDPAAEMVSAAQAQSAGALRWVQAQGERLPFRSGSLAGVVCSQSLHWIDEERFLPEVRRCLHQRGVLAVAWQQLSTHGADIEGLLEGVLLETVGLGPDQTGRRRDMDEVVACVGDGWEPTLAETWNQSIDWSPELVGLYLKSRIPAATDRLVQHMADVARASLGESFSVEFMAQLSCWRLL